VQNPRTYGDCCYDLAMKFQTISRFATIAALCAFSVTGCGAGGDGSGGAPSSEDLSDVEAVGRWHFAAPAVADEWQRKQERLKQIDLFWRALQHDAPNLIKEAVDNNHPTALTDWAVVHIKSIHPDLMYEFGPLSKTGAMLTVTSEEKNYLRPIIQTLMERKKPVKGWTFAEYRESLPAAAMDQAFTSRLQQPIPPAFEAHCKVSGENAIDIEFVSDKFTGDNAQKDLLGAFGLCDVILGEEEAERWVGNLETKHGPAPQDSDVVKSAEKFKATYQSTKQELLNKIPSTPFYARPRPDGEAVMPMEPMGEGRITIGTPYPDVFLPLNAPSRFFTSRLSKSGERFAYLQVDGAEKLAADAVKRGQLEDQIDKQLRAAKLGCVVGGGAGTSNGSNPDRFYIDVMLADPDKAVPILQRLVSSNSLPHAAWLKFYDADWRQEWVGMYNDTPPPADPRKMW
jgi:hypothetical protein